MLSWGLIVGGATTASLLVVLVTGYLIIESLPLLLHGGAARFFTDDGWWPLDSSFNMLPMFSASLLLTLASLLLATPLSLAFSCFTVFYAPPGLGALLQRLIDVSAAVPTVIYGLGEKFDGNLTRAHLQTDTPYNTYTRAGFPPTPIAMPGRASLSAAGNPATTKLMYFVARGDGSSEFSETLDAHNRAVAKFQLKK